MIKLSNVSKNYGNVKALDSLSLEIKEGEIFGLLGPNGAGKTTAVKILTTLTKPDSGSCFINEIDVVQNPHKIKKLSELSLKRIILKENLLCMKICLFMECFIILQRLRRK
jgi:ABC-type multidrug transport system ATPase subunit